MKNTDFGIGYQFRGGGIDFKNWPKVELVDPGLVYAIGTPPELSAIYLSVYLYVCAHVLFCVSL